MQWQNCVSFKLPRASYFRYNPLTATFTVPPGGDGLYYFSTFFSVDSGQYAEFEVTTNGNSICRAFGDNDSNGDWDYAQATCSGLARLVEGTEDIYWIDFMKILASQPSSGDFPWPLFCFYSVLFPSQEIEFRCWVLTALIRLRCARSWAPTTMASLDSESKSSLSCHVLLLGQLWENANLTKTIASVAEWCTIASIMKLEWTSWNLFACLGKHSDK